MELLFAIGVLAFIALGRRKPHPHAAPHVAAPVPALPSCDGDQWLLPAQRDVPKEVTDRAVQIVASSAPMGAKLVERVAGRVWRFQVEIHGANESNPNPHRGVGVRLCSSSSAASGGVRRDGSAEERLAWLATHESGHAVVAWHCPVVGSVENMSIERVFGGQELWKGHVTHDWKPAREDEKLSWNIVISLAGLAAEVMRYGEVRSLLMLDVEEALTSAKKLRRLGAAWPSNYEPEIALPVDDGCTQEDAQILKGAWGTTCRMLSRHADAHARLATAIAAHRRLGDSELSQLLGPKHPGGNAFLT